MNEFQHQNHLSDETRDAHLGGADAVVVAELAALLAHDHGLDVAGQLAAALTLTLAGRQFGRRLGQQRHHARRLQLHLVPASGLLRKGNHRGRRRRCRRPRQYPPLRVRDVRVRRHFSWIS